DPGQRVVHLDVVDLEVGDRARATGTPVDDARAAVDVALAIEVRKETHDGARVLLVHREAVAPVVERGAEGAQLPHDLAPVIANEVPAEPDELLAADVVEALALGSKAAPHHGLQRDSGVVVPGLPERVEVAHPMPANEDVLRRSVQ